MQIRKATYMDASAIKLLLDALGYKTKISLLVNQIETLFGKDDHEVFVYELQKDVLGFISMHYIPQLAFEGELALITYLSVEDTWKELGVGKALEEFVVKQAIKRKCDQIQVHCLDWRTPAHKFYEQQGYQEYPKYFTKKLVYAGNQQ